MRRPSPGRPEVRGSRSFEVRRETEPDPDGRIRGVRGAASILRPPTQVDGAVERLHEAPRIDDASRGVGVRQILIAEQHPPAELDRVDPELTADLVDEGLQGEVRLRLPEATVGAGRRLVRHDLRDRALGHRDPIRTGDLARRHEGRVDPGHEDLARTHVVDQVTPQRGDRPVVAHGGFELHGLLASLTAGHEMLATILDPPHRPPQLHREPRDEDLFRVDVRLHPEAAADVGGDHVDIAFEERQHEGEGAARDVGALRPGVEREPPVAELGDAPAGLDRHTAVTMHRVAAAHHPMRVEDRDDVIRGCGTGGRDPHDPVVGPGVVELGGVIGERRSGRCHHRERIVVHVHELGTILGSVAIPTDHRGDRSSHVAHRPAREWEGGDVSHVRDEVRERTDADEIGGGHGRDDLVRRPGASQVDPDACMREEAPHHGHLDHPRQLDVRDEPGAPTEEAIVFDASDPRTEVRGAAREPQRRHGRFRGPSSILRRPGRLAAARRGADASLPDKLAACYERPTGSATHGAYPARMEVRAEFSVYPFEEGEAPPAYVQIAIDTLTAAGLAVEVGPFGQVVVGETSTVLGALRDAQAAALEAGATRVAVNLVRET